MNKFSRKYFATFLIVVLTILISAKSHAVIISVVPSNTSLSITDVVTVEVIASDLGNFSAPSISAYDIALNFDNTVLQYNSYVLGGNLDLGLFGSFGFAQDLGTSIRVDETSFESVFDLENLQSDSFTLFTLTFTAIANGTSALLTDVFSISNASGSTLLQPTAINNSSITVGTVTASAPNALALIFLGLLLVYRKHAKSLCRKLVINQ